MEKKGYVFTGQRNMVFKICNLIFGLPVWSVECCECNINRIVCGIFIVYSRIPLSEPLPSNEGILSALMQEQPVVPAVRSFTCSLDHAVD